MSMLFISELKDTFAVMIKKWNWINLGKVKDWESKIWLKGSRFFQLSCWKMEINFFKD